MKTVNEAMYCRECTRNDFIATVPNSAEANPADETVPKPESLPRDYPKVIVVVGIWAIFLPGLITSFAFLYEILAGKVGGAKGFVGFWLSLVGSLISGYVLYRSMRNYQLHKRRIAEQEETNA